MDDFSPSTQGWIIAFGSAAVLWMIAKIKPGTSALAFRFSTWLLAKELRRAKRARVDTFAIQREISKEAALFMCFMLSFLITTGFFLTVAGEKSFSTKMLVATLLMLPTLVIEIWWLTHRDYVATLIKEAGKLTVHFRRAIPNRPQSKLRTLKREARCKKLKSGHVTYRRVTSKR